jgi:hypothetical protein
MPAPIWIVIFDRSGEQLTIIRCRHDSEADGVIYHNTYYGRRCLKVGVKNWR